ncbi:iron-containing redox enzyme family protein [Zhihengliuella sp.]|uniref:iron-containing redox enzyme family protein n=1 Tax=Zhihengliuella sp. TaxID=1954483 RepID=UPI002810AC42|nr:iron-containing redox enzyme family protein [Zhihengliuella sp.]
MKFPPVRGAVSSALLDVLASAPHGGAAPTHGTAPAAAGEPLRRLEDAVVGALAGTAGLVADDDVQLALYCLYELHYRGLDGVDPRWEWDPELLRVRAIIESAFEAELRRLAAGVDLPGAAGSAQDGDTPDGGAAPRDAGTVAEDIARTLFALVAADDGPSVSRYIGGKAAGWQLQEFLVHKSVYQLKEADPHTWAIPRLSGRAKAAMVEIQADEYGGGRPDRMHSALFAGTMRAAGLDDAFGAYVGHVPGRTLAGVNMMSLFGLHRRLRGAICGHLAVYEMTSSIPNKHYARGFRKHGYDDAAVDYFDEHVEADAVHEQIAGRDLAGGLVAAEPELLDDVLFGARAALAVDALQGSANLEAWRRGESSLLVPLPEAELLPAPA